METINRKPEISTCNGGAELIVNVVPLARTIVLNYSPVSHKGELVGPDGLTYEGRGNSIKRTREKTIGAFTTGHCFEQCYPKNKCSINGKPVY